MTEEPVSFSSTTNEVSRVELLLTIARAKGSLLSAKDVDELTDLVPAGADLGSIWNQIPSLDSQYEVKGGLLVERRVNNNQTSSGAIEDQKWRRARAERYIEYAREFSLLSGKTWIRVLSIAGSTSYKATSENDDIDIFCVTEKDSLWIYLTKALLLARVFKLVRPGSPRFCFSCVLDEDYARRLFASPNDALFARDALTAQVLRGSLFYDGLLQRAQWLSDYFPKLHGLRKAQHIGTFEDTNVTRPTVARKALNHFLFLTVGCYLRLKSILLNRKLRRTGRLDSLFRVISSPDRCVFESQRYQALRRIYSEFKPYSAEYPSPVKARVQSS
jgi:hypothetical protein